jgi:sensor c-di-GMP phosphodiesterase-like protein
LEKARILREAEEAKEKARAAKAIEDLKQKRLNETHNLNSMKQPSTWDRMIKPAVTKVPSSASSAPPQTASAKPSTYIQAPVSTSKKGLMETIFGVKKHTAVENSHTTIQQQQQSTITGSKDNFIPPQKVEVDTRELPKEIIQSSSITQMETISKPPTQPFREMTTAGAAVTAKQDDDSDEYQIEDR